MIPEPEDLWHSADDEEVLVAYAAAHSPLVEFDKTDRAITIGWGGFDTVLPLPAETACCGACGTPVGRYEDAGWRHLYGMRQRGGCTTPWPGTAT